MPHFVMFSEPLQFTGDPFTDFGDQWRYTSSGKNGTISATFPLNGYIYIYSDNDFTAFTPVPGYPNPRTINTLPPGFTPLNTGTSGFPNDPYINSGIVLSGTSSVSVTLDDLTSAAQPITANASYSVTNLPLTLPTNLVTLMGTNVAAFTFTNPVSSVCAFLNYSQLEVHGWYELLSFTWYYNPNTNQYQYASSDPGGSWVETVQPTMWLDYVVPDYGEALTATSVTLIGGGFGIGATVTFGGDAATNVSVVDQNTITCDTPAHAAGFVNVVVTNPDSETATKVNGYEFITKSWWYLKPLNYYKKSLKAPTDEISFNEPTYLDYLDDTYGPLIPKRYTFVWTEAPLPPTDTGWWLSISEQFAGTGILINNNRPKDPRTFGKLNFATGSAKMMGGFPGPCAVLDNRMIYAEDGYTLDSGLPIIRIFNGTLDRELIRVPPTSSSAITKAVVTIIAANDTIYFSTLDSGTSSADWAGRVFSLDPLSTNIELIGAAFGSGEVPYALTWHAGRLWCGTNSLDPTVEGKVYYYRPGIDTTWTMDRDLTTDGLGGVCSLLSYKGNLLVGTTAPSGTFAKVLSRSTLGAYTTSTTATGGTAVANNGFLAMTEFQDNIYASFWNDDTTPVSKIYKFDNSTWSTVYTGSGTTNIPFIAFPQDSSVLLAYGGGLSYTAAIIRSTDGTTWVDRTAFLQQDSPVSTAIPVFGVLKR